ncbi:CopD family protein [Microvirga brassicacearum]|nr:CopD family protein [Microvirga brassicacearum]
MLAGGGQAFAHAALVESVPADGAVLQVRPAIVHLRFNEPVSPLVVRLIDARGGIREDLSVMMHDHSIGIAIPENLPSGSHILSYRVTSADGHPVAGSMIFSIGHISTSADKPAETSERPIHSLLWLARLVFYLGAFVGAGGALFVTWVAPSLRLLLVGRVLRGFLAAGIAAAIVSIGLQGLDALGRPFVDFPSGAVWLAGLATAFGTSAILASTAFALAFASLLARGGSRRALSLAALAGVGLAFAASGHASAATPQWLMRPVMFLHAVAVAYWVGALLPLAVVVRRFPSQAQPVIRRFSGVAVAAVAVLTATGLMLAYVQVEAPKNLFDTDYGLVLLAKLILVAALLALASVNRVLLTPGLEVSRDKSRHRLGRTIAIEIGLAALVLMVVGLWRFTPPPRALETSRAAAASPVSLHIHMPSIMAGLMVSPGHVGSSQVRIALSSPASRPLDAKGVTLILSRPADGIEPIERSARKVGGNAWQVDNLVLPLAGPWQIRLEVLISDFDKTSLEGTLVVRP